MSNPGNGNRFGAGTGGNSAKGKLIAFLIVAVCGLQFIVSSAVYAYKYNTALNNYTASADGVVTGVVVKKTTSTGQRHSRSKTTRYYYPKYSFTVDGVTYNAKSDAAYDKEYCVEGNPAAVLYDPNDPRKSCLAGDIEAYKNRVAASPFYCGTGIFIIVCGAGAVFGKKKRRN